MILFWREKKIPNKVTQSVTFKTEERLFVLTTPKILCSISFESHFNNRMNCSFLTYTESDIYEDPAVMYEGVVANPDPIDLKNYLVSEFLLLAFVSISEH